jgi:hypothetical protein
MDTTQGGRLGVERAWSDVGDLTNGYSRRVGRVGGLAFALGIGAAVLAGAGAAQADAPDSGGTDDRSASPSSHGTGAGPGKSESESTARARVKFRARTESDAAPKVRPAATAATGQLNRRPTLWPTQVPIPATPTAGAVAAAQAAPNPFFNNQSPTLAYDSAENQVVNGHIQGNLHPADPDSPKLTYTATKPTAGTVAISPDGTFDYTPVPIYGGKDIFSVTVSDAASGFHVHGFAGLLNLLSFGLIGTSGHKKTETVFIGDERTTVASGLTLPVDFRFLPDGRILVAEKNGPIKVVKPDGTVLPDPLITLSVNTLFERGIGGLAVDPQFATNGYVYVAYTTSEVKDRLSRFTVVGDTAAPGSEKVLLETPDTVSGTHRGGALDFGPDGKLYWGKGDNGTGANAQNLTNLHGKILRINPDGSTPSDNPVLPEGALPQIYAYGLRNPFRMTFTPTGQLLVGDVGDKAFEELDLVTAGGNYGWPGAEGLCTSNCAGLVDPIYTYPRGAGSALAGVVVHQGTKLFIADEVQKWVKLLTCNASFTACGDPKDYDLGAGSIVALGQGPESAPGLYRLNYLAGTLVRIAPPASA